MVHTSSSIGPSVNGSFDLFSTLCSLSNLNAFESLPPGVEGKLILEPSDLSLSMVKCDYNVVVVCPSGPFAGKGIKAECGEGPL